MMTTRQAGARSRRRVVIRANVCRQLVESSIGQLGSPSALTRARTGGSSRTQSRPRSRYSQPMHLITEGVSEEPPAPQAESSAGHARHPASRVRHTDRVEADEQTRGSSKGSIT
jgi:hypothetical protein